MITTKARYRVHRFAFLVEQEMAGALEGLNSANGLVRPCSGFACE
jgi:hypothetical protein